MGDHIELAKLMIGMGATSLGLGLEAARNEGHREIVLLLLDIAQDRGHPLNTKDLLWSACRFDLLERAKEVVSRCEHVDDIEIGLFFACVGGHRRLMRLMLDHGASSTCGHCDRPAMAHAT